jgi:sugar/nucleoside kinase (ribokinase family)
LVWDGDSFALSSFTHLILLIRSKLPEVQLVSFLKEEDSARFFESWDPVVPRGTIRVELQPNSLDWTELGSTALLSTGATTVVCFGGGIVVGEEYKAACKRFEAAQGDEITFHWWPVERADKSGSCVLEKCALAALQGSSTLVRHGIEESRSASSDPPQVCFLGIIVADNISVLPEGASLKVDGKQVAARRFTRGGGNAANAAVAAQRLGCSCRLVSKVGADALGKKLVVELEGEGVNCEGVVTAHPGDGSTVSCEIIVAGETRTIISMPHSDRVSDLRVRVTSVSVSASGGGAGGGDGHDSSASGGAAAAVGEEVVEEEEEAKAVVATVAGAGAGGGGPSPLSMLPVDLDATAVDRALAGCLLLVVDGRHPAAALQVAGRARRLGVKVLVEAEDRASLNLDHTFQALLALADFLITNETFPTRFFPNSNVEEHNCDAVLRGSLTAMLGCCPSAQWVVATCGARGFVAALRSSRPLADETGTGGKCSGGETGARTAERTGEPTVEFLQQPAFDLTTEEETAAATTEEQKQEVEGSFERRRSTTAMVVDTTGAGDAALGALAAVLARHESAVKQQQQQKQQKQQQQQQQAELEQQPPTPPTSPPPPPPLQKAEGAEQLPHGNAKSSSSGESTDASAANTKRVLVTALKVAAWAAARNCTAEGARGGMPTAAEAPQSIAVLL